MRDCKIFFLLNIDTEEIRVMMEKKNEEIIKIRNPTFLERLEAKSDSYPCLTLRITLAKYR